MARKSQGLLLGLILILVLFVALVYQKRGYVHYAGDDPTKPSSLSYSDPLSPVLILKPSGEVLVTCPAGSGFRPHARPANAPETMSCESKN